MTTQPILNAAPIQGWLNRMAEPLYGRQTPDGYGFGGGRLGEPWPNGHAF